MGGETKVGGRHLDQEEVSKQLAVEAAEANQAPALEGGERKFKDIDVSREMAQAIGVADPRIHFQR